MTGAALRLYHTPSSHPKDQRYLAVRRKKYLLDHQAAAISPFHEGLLYSCTDDDDATDAT